MATNKLKKTVKNNKGLVKQLLNDIKAECYEGCVVSITSLAHGEKEYETVGSIDRVDLGEGRIYINEAQAIESVPFSEITGYKWR